MSEIVGYIEKLKSALEAINAGSIDLAVELVRKTWMDGRQIIVFGNGGSAFTASHFIMDMNKTVFLKTGRPFRGLCLNDNLGLVTAYANDVSYTDIFVEQLKFALQSDDLVIAVSGSGNSPNVIKAVEFANTHDAITIGVCGYDGGKLKQIARHNVHVPVHDMQITEDVHLAFFHLILRSLI